VLISSQGRLLAHQVEITTALSIQLSNSRVLLYDSMARGNESSALRFAPEVLDPHSEKRNDSVLLHSICIVEVLKQILIPRQKPRKKDGSHASAIYGNGLVIRVLHYRASS